MINFASILSNLFNHWVTNALTCEVLELGGLGFSGWLDQVISDVWKIPHVTENAGDEHWWCHSFQWKVSIVLNNNLQQIPYPDVVAVDLVDTKETILMTLCWCNEAPLGTRHVHLPRWRELTVMEALPVFHPTGPLQKNQWVAFLEAWTVSCGLFASKKVWIVHVKPEIV